jgi:hypothetical protein
VKEIRIDLKHGAGGVGYRINPMDRTYVSGSLENGELVEPTIKGEFENSQKFASQLYYLILASLDDKTKPKEELQKPVDNGTV